MLEPCESDIPGLFLVLVVLPLVAYILLGKWSEIAKKRDRIALLAQLAAEEALKSEDMAITDVIPPVPSSNNALHVCARCSAPGRTRCCSRCKTVRYCSEHCQIIHWRQIHKHECQQLQTHKLSMSPLAVSVDEFRHGSDFFYQNMNSQFFGHKLKQCIKENTPLDNFEHPPKGTSASAAADCALFNNSQVAAHERRTSHRSNRETWRRDIGTIYDSSIESFSYKASSSPFSEEEFMRPKSRNNYYSVLEGETSNKVNTCGSGQNASRSRIVEGDNCQSQHGNTFIPRNNYGHPSLSIEANNGKIIDGFETDIVTKGGNVVEGGNLPSYEAAQCSSEMTIKGSVKDKKVLPPSKARCSKSPRSTSAASVDLCYPELEKKGQIADVPNVDVIRDTTHSQCSNVAASTGNMKTMGLRKSSKLSALATSEGSGDMCREIEMLFPYEKFLKLFQGDVFGICPRGLLNCGNSCYANAILQCLTCTKPLVAYLLQRSHSESCCAKDRCLMCELEQHIMMLRENGGPLSPSRILWYMQSINCQMGSGSQEDAHEFLRLLIASMQSICLERLFGEENVNPRLQETTFVQHTFGGRLQSKVMCLNCNHKSKRYENIMDLTLEILGWVESLEDALTQYTSPEDLDGENMYKCGRCTAYVRARKQLTIHEAPNILTIVLKRFQHHQEGRYGKINKYITFPEMLDIIPFMTGTGDIPPRYMLYAVVVHLDTLNASFSGHYISYVKDLQGNWFRIDDTEVQPVLTSQVMSKGAYILFYMRSYPRSQGAFTRKASRQRVSKSSKPCPKEAPKSSKPRHRRHGSQFVVPEPSPDNSNGILRRSTNRKALPVTETYAENINREISDVTSSD